MKKSKQFVIYPHNDNSEKQPNLTPQDKLIYLAIRRSMDGLTMESSPSYEKLRELTGASPKTIKKCIDNLVREEYLETRKNGKRIVYKFNNKKKYECFNYDFLDKKDLTFTEKAYIVASHQYMFEQDNGTKTISYSNEKLSELIHMPKSTISKCNRSLQEKGYLEDSKELTKVFKARDLDLVFIEKFKEHEKRIDTNTEDIEILKEKVRQLEAENRQIKEQANIKTQIIL